MDRTPILPGPEYRAIGNLARFLVPALIPDLHLQNARDFGMVHHPGRGVTRA
jgi:hypothetical protein